MEYNESDFKKIPDESFAKFEDKGDKLIGTLVKVTNYIDNGPDKNNPKPTSSYKFCFLTKDGERKLFSKPEASFIVRNKLNTVKLGDVVMLTYTKSVPIPNTVFKRKEFEVAVLPTKNLEWLQENESSLSGLDDRKFSAIGGMTSGKAIEAATPTQSAEDEIRVEDIEPFVS